MFSSVALHLIDLRQDPSWTLALMDGFCLAVWPVLSREPPVSVPTSTPGNTDAKTFPVGAGTQTQDLMLIM